MEELASQVYKRSTASDAQSDNKTPFKVHLMWGHYFIVLDDSIHPSEDQWYLQERQTNGDILFKRRALRQ